jgi:peroxiredoxin
VQYVHHPRVRVGTANSESKWQLLIVIRGQHCPLCAKYLGKLAPLLERYAAANVDVVVTSSDTKEQTAAMIEKYTIDPAVVARMTYGLPAGFARESLGCYISHPRSEAETDHVFPEPGVFVIRDDGITQIVDVSNAPFARPDLENLIGGIEFVRKNDYPIRGTA